MTVYKASDKSALYYFFGTVLFITPHLPMPTGLLGPIGPALYLSLFLFFIFYQFTKPVSFSFSNNFFSLLFICQIILLATDILRIGIFVPAREYPTALVRVVNLGVFIVCSYFFVNYDKSQGIYIINPKLFKLFIYSVMGVTLVFYLQSFGVLPIGHGAPGRTFFGVQLPFQKPIGFVEISDGKIGTFIAPIALLFIVNSYKGFEFIKLKYKKVFIIIFSVIIVILQSRSGYLAYFVGLVFLFLLYPSKQSKFLKMVVAIFTLAVILFSDIYVKVWKGLTGEGIYERNVESRGTTMKHAFDQFVSSPIWGVGHDEIALEVSSSHSVGAHNLFTDHLGSGGLITFIPLMIMFIMFYVYTFKLYFLAIKLKNAYLSGLSVWLLSSMATIIIELNFYRGLYNEYVYLFLSFGIVAYLNYIALANRRV